MASAASSTSSAARWRVQSSTGKILPGGADWQIVRTDGVVHLQARYTVETETGGQILVEAEGYRHGPPEVMERLARDETVDPSLYYFRTFMRFETADPASGLAEPYPGHRLRRPREQGGADRGVRGAVVRLDRPEWTPHESDVWQSRPRSAFTPKLPPSLTAKRRGDVAILRLSRPQKRNALDDTTVLGIEASSTALPTASRPWCCTARASISPPASTSAN